MNKKEYEKWWKWKTNRHKNSFLLFVLCFIVYLMRSRFLSDTRCETHTKMIPILNNLSSNNFYSHIIKNSGSKSYMSWLGLIDGECVSLESIELCFLTEMRLSSVGLWRVVAGLQVLAACTSAVHLMRSRHLLRILTTMTVNENGQSMRNKRANNGIYL